MEGPHDGDQLGRYLVRQRLGAGGMGVVFVADDPKLGRRVAIKLLRTPRASDDPSEGPARLIREAQALAKLSHPNVIDVYDVGTTGNKVFVAMEYVEGQTLAEWLRSSTRSTQSILDCFAQAGRGLAAAHAAGIVHRDFKPANVIVADDGRTRVLDFGLAAAAGRTDAGSLTPTSGSTAEDEELELRMTATGIAMGTPAYMAPEQHRGEPPNPSSDQFAFCVALWEALHGRRPYAATRWEELLEQKMEPRSRVAPADSVVPPWVHSAIERGLEPDPARRWSSMEPLLSALAPRRVRATAPWIAMLVATVGVATVIVALDQEPGPDCGRSAASVTDAFTDEHRAQIDAAFAASSLPYAAAARNRLGERLDVYAAELATMRIDACLAAAGARQGEDRERDQLVACLDERTSELDALVQIMVAADDATIEHAATATARLSPVQSCRELESDDPSRPAPELADAVAEIRKWISAARVLKNAGQHDAALAKIDASLESARAVGFAPVEAEALMYRGLVLDALGKHEEAAQALSDAAMSAISLRDDDIAAAAASHLVFVLGTRLARLEEAEEWARHAQVAVQRAGATTLRRALLEGSLGNLALTRGESEPAIRHFEVALELQRELGLEDDPQVSMLLGNLGMASLMRGKVDESVALLRETLERRKRYYGDTHPLVGSSLGNLATALQRSGDLEGAADNTKAAFEVFVASLPPDHPNLARAELNLANVHFLQGRRAEALAGHRRALQRFERINPGSPQVAMSLSNIGACLQADERYAEAREYYTRSIEVSEDALGPKHPNVGDTLLNLAQVDLQEERNDDAERGFARAMAIAEESAGREHRAYASAMLGLGRAHLAKGQARQALDELAHAADLMRKVGDSAVRAEAGFALARARWEVGEDREQAVAEAKGALAEAQGAGAAQQSRADAIAAWLREHR